MSCGEPRHRLNMTCVYKSWCVCVGQCMCIGASRKFPFHSLPSDFLFIFLAKMSVPDIEGFKKLCVLLHSLPALSCSPSLSVPLALSPSCSLLFLSLPLSLALLFNVMAELPSQCSQLTHNLFKLSPSLSIIIFPLFSLPQFSLSNVLPNECGHSHLQLVFRTHVIYWSSVICSAANGEQNMFNSKVHSSLLQEQTLKISVSGIP